MSELSIDIETLGTNIGDQILSVGLAIFDITTGEIGETRYLRVQVDPNQSINATLGTITWWIDQAKENPEALEGLFTTNAWSIGISGVLSSIHDFVTLHQPEGVWANGTKFNLAMLEHQFKQHSIDVPWPYNSDRCLRTLRSFAGKIEIKREGAAHNALYDAIWQAKYISAAVKKLNLLEKC